MCKQPLELWSSSHGLCCSVHARTHVRAARKTLACSLQQASAAPHGVALIAAARRHSLAKGLPLRRSSLQLRRLKTSSDIYISKMVICHDAARVASAHALAFISFDARAVVSARCSGHIRLPKTRTWDSSSWNLLSACCADLLDASCGLLIALMRGRW